MRLLIVDDNVVLAWKLQGYLGKQFEVQVARTGHEGQRLAETGRYDAIILDLSLPDRDGQDICMELRRKGVTTPILILTAENTLDSKVRLLEYGADDYVTKPFALAELKARIKALMRRRQVGPPPQLLTVGDLTIDPNRRTVKRGDKVIQLRRKEFDILEYLVRNKSAVITSQMIFDHIWDNPDQNAWHNAVRVHIKHLRDKIDRPFPTSLIKTARGVGYSIEEP